MKRLLNVKYTLLFSAFCGYALASSGATLNVLNLYDHIFPVVDMRGTLVAYDPSGAALVHVGGSKLRDCQFIQIDSYSVSRTGILRDANEERVDDLPVDGGTKPPGTYDLGVWRIYPVVAGATAVRMYVEHSCNSRLVYTLIADVPLEGVK
jgi:hypothetical protein